MSSPIHSFFTIAGSRCSVVTSGYHGSKRAKLRRSSPIFARNVAARHSEAANLLDLHLLGGIISQS
jgi:hypothetical protein